MGKIRPTPIATFSLVAFALAAPALARQAEPVYQPSAPTTSDKAQPATPPVTVSQAQLDRIQKALSNPEPIKLDDRQVRFYMDIIARQPTFAQYAKGYDFLNGPVKRGSPMTHQEFLNLVTPKELYSSGGITATDQLQFAITNYFGQMLIKKALEEIQQAKSEREVEAIRERITRELEALRNASSR